MKASLSRHLAVTVFLMNGIIIIASLLTVGAFVADIEKSILELELNNEATYFARQITLPVAQSWNTARLEVRYLPDGTDDTTLPDYQQNRPVPFTKEVLVDGKTFLLRIDQIQQPAGRLYLAQDISVLESREALIITTLFSTALVMMLMGLLVAWFVGRLVSRPLKKLSHDILRVEPSKQPGRLSGDYTYREFEEISSAFNRFLSTMEQYIRREKSFVKLASHELRTPLSVISGALDVIEQRNDLSAADTKTLQRIRTATQSMREDTDLLLQLARGEHDLNDIELIDISATLSHCIIELERGQPLYGGRITLSPTSDQAHKCANTALVRMLFRNLLQNALNHTRSEVSVIVTDNQVTIRDFDQGLPADVIQLFQPARSHPADSDSGSSDTRNTLQESSFGLLIVQMVCDKLGWTLSIPYSGADGTEIVISMTTANNKP